MRRGRISSPRPGSPAVEFDARVRTGADDGQRTQVRRRAATAAIVTRGAGVGRVELGAATLRTFLSRLQGGKMGDITYYYVTTKKKKMRNRV